MLIGEHIQLRGHWNILQQALGTDKEALRVALDTDGKILIEKLREHITKENEFFDKLREDSPRDLNEFYYSEV
jgi:hypothetical protein